VLAEQARREAERRHRQAELDAAWQRLTANDPKR
jgi:hypothetical protein